MSRVSSGKNALFLTAYREYEQLLKSKGLDVSSIESSTETPKDVSDKIRICRQMRNFMSHNDDPEFLNASDSQIAFLTNLVYEERLKEDCAKDHMRGLKSASVSSKDKCTDALDKLIRLKTDKIVVIDGYDIGVASIFDVAKAAQATKTSKMSSVKTTSDFREAYEETPMQTLRTSNTKVFIVKKHSSKAEEKMVGVIYL